MKTVFKIIALVLIIAFSSCGDINFPAPVSSFDSSFPKGNRDLSRILGDAITIRNSSDTLSLKISANKNTNLILNSKNGDTIFYGKICKFRGLYYFNQQLKNGTYWIYTVKIEDSLVYGLQTGFFQMLAVDNEIKKGHYKNLVKFISPDTSVIDLHPDKREMKKLFSSNIESFTPDTIINYLRTSLKTTDTSTMISPVDPEDFNIISKAYPNPTTNFINIELQQKGMATFQLSDIDGKILLDGHFKEALDKIDLSKEKTGVYFLTILNDADKQKETIKIVKTN
jgi:hypothetical protein